MIYCRVEDGVVVDRAVFDAEIPNDWPDRKYWVRNDDAQIGWAYLEGIFSEPHRVEPNKPTTYRLYKSTLIRRLSESEAVSLTALLKSSPVKMQMLWDASEYLVSDDPLFDDLTMAISGALGEDRASEILGEDK